MPCLQAPSKLLRSAGGKFLIRPAKLFLAALVILNLAAFSYAAPVDIIQPASGELRTSDNISISYNHYKKNSDTVIIVCPGFFNSKDNRWMRKAVDMLSARYDVISFDFRGHGKSGGVYTWSAKEDLDLDAVINYAKSCGYKHIGILAFSLGAAASINEAAVRGDIDSMVLISCPSRFQHINFNFWELGMFSDLKDNIDCKWEGKGARAGSIFLKKKDPIDSVRLIKSTPILFIHGDADWVVKSRHSERLYAAATTEKRIEIVKGGLHAERLLQFHYESMRDIILDWFARTIK